MRYFKKMLIPADGCDAAKAGVLQGLRITKYLGTDTTIVISVDDAIFFKDECECTSFEACEGIVDEMSEAAQSIGLGVKIISKEGDSKNVVGTFIKDDEDINLVTIGIKGSKDPTDSIIGLLHKYLLKEARIPVIIQTYFGKKFLHKFNDYRKKITDIEPHKVTLLVAMDGSEQAERAAFEAIQFANQLNVGSRVHAVHVVESLKDADGKEKMDPADFMAIPEKAKKIGLAFGVIVVPEVIIAEDKAQGIVTKAAEIKADMIVMGTHGKTGALARFMGNKTEFVLKTVPIPVMVVPPELRRPMMDIEAEEYVDDIWDELP